MFAARQALEGIEKFCLNGSSPHLLKIAAYVFIYDGALQPKSPTKTIKNQRALSAPVRRV